MITLTTFQALVLGIILLSTGTLYGIILSERKRLRRKRIFK